MAGDYSARYAGPCFASIYVTDGAVAQTPDQNVATKLTAFTTNGLSCNCTADAANDRIAITIKGTYLVMLEASFSGDASSSVHGIIYKGAVPAVTAFEFERKLGTGGDIGSASCHGLLELDAGEYVEAWIMSDDATPNVTFRDATLTVIRLN